LPLHDSGEAAGLVYYVMPYVEGESLRDKLDREKQLSIEETTELAAQVAGALGYAHRRKVIHRDIKPANILLHDGNAVVADFGIALAVSQAGGTRITETGLSLGTPHYMSPEQATADRELTPASDVYSLACMTYEMLVGDPPHTGSTAQAIIAKVITETPARVTLHRPKVPLHVEATIMKGLEKLPADRFTGAQDFADALRDPRKAPITLEVAGPSAPGTSSSRPFPKFLKGALAVTLLGATAVVGWIFRGPDGMASRQVGLFSIPVPEGLRYSIRHLSIAISPDGQTIAYVSQEGLYARRLDNAEPELLVMSDEIAVPFFAPDDDWLGFAESGVLKKVSLGGGAVANIPSGKLVSDWGDVAWGPDGEVIKGGSGAIQPILRSGEPEDLTTLEGDMEVFHGWPQVVDDRKALVFTVGGPSGLWNDAKVVVQDLETGTRTTVVEGGTFGRYVDGYVVFVRGDGAISAVPFDLGRREVVGRPFTVESGIRVAYWGGGGGFAVSETGTLAYVGGSDWANHVLVWVDRQGRRLGRVGRPMTVEPMHLSSDDRWVTMYVARPGNSDIYRFDTETGEEQRLTFEQATNDNPMWLPDGRIAYRMSVSGGDHRIYVRDAVGANEPVVAYSSNDIIIPEAGSPDGRWMIVTELDPDTGADLYAVRMDSSDTVVPISVSPNQESDASLSPDARWLTYVSDETGRNEVYAVAFPAMTGKLQVSVGGGSSPKWAATNELFFVNGDTIMVTKVRTGNLFEREVPRALFVSSEKFRTWDVASDGKRFLMAVRNPDALSREVHVVLNWLEVLREKSAGQRGQ
ncbi:MAG TPA: serine/threonine-protein kinase, partial [Actinobacteria bacterium]|nr:serine/threonine-protein kinase [Actinomycetota bacterium]